MSKRLHLVSESGEQNLFFAELPGGGDNPFDTPYIHVGRDDKWASAINV